MSDHTDPAQQIVAHTPGPWSYYLDAEGHYAINHESDAHEPGDIAHVAIPGAIDPEYDDGNEGLANARLIAAAPTMLAALKRALNGLVAWKEEQEREHPWSVDGWKVEEEVRAAIALAEGRAS